METNQPSRSEIKAEFDAFGKWRERYLGADLRSKDALKDLGARIALRRKTALERLIRTDPELAIQLAIVDPQLNEFPSEVRENLEKRVSGWGSIEVREVCGPESASHATHSIYSIHVNGQNYQGYVYGRRIGQPSRKSVPIHGVAIGQLLAISDQPTRILDTREALESRSAITNHNCQICGLPAASLAAAQYVRIGDRVVAACSHEHALAINQNCIAEEEKVEVRALGSEPVIRAAQSGGNSWTTGHKKVILIRVDFSDLTGQSFSASTGNSIIETANTVYAAMSSSKTSFALGGAGSDVSSSVFRMPQTASWYGTFDFNGNTLRTHARSAAQLAGYDLSKYDFDIICFKPVPGWSSWTGQANVGAAGAWVQGSPSHLVFVHELGHNLGLNHANSWDTGGASVIGPGTRIEYGDIFDIMGFGFQSDARYHFNARYKNYLNWLTEDDVITVSTNGMFRIYAHDVADGAGVRGLKIPRNSLTNYWVEFRQSLTSNKSILNGAGLRWAQNGNQRSLLLDTTPGSGGGWNDSALVIGRTFSDFDAGIHITPVSKGNTSPESLDVVVNFGVPVTNLPPVGIVSSDVTNVAVNIPVSIQCVASDPNGDTLVYDWDFGDGDFGTNGPTASHSWTSAGEYVVRCRVSDMKGGYASTAVLIIVGSPGTYRIAGRVTESGVPLENARVSVSASRQTYTDSEGRYILTGLSSGSYSVNANLYGYTISRDGFSNPLVIETNRTEVNFLAAATNPKPPSIAFGPEGLAVSSGGEAVFSVTAAGTPLLAYQWFFNGSSVPGANSNMLVLTDVSGANVGEYFVVVNNSVGAVTSSIVRLELDSSLAITTHPQSQIATISSNAGFSVVATGTPPLAYQWYSNGTNPIVGGTNAMLTLTNVQDANAGTYRVVVSNGSSSVSSSNATLTINHPPLLSSPVLERLATTGAKARIADFLGTDPDGDAVTLVAVGPTSTQGGTVVTNSGWVIYSPPAGYTNADSFPFVLSDGRGGFSSGTALVTVISNNVVPDNFRAELLPDGSVRLSFDGIPGRNYSIEYTSDLQDPNWQTLATVAADAFGSFAYLDLLPPGAPQRFYRAAWP